MVINIGGACWCVYKLNIFCFGYAGPWDFVALILYDTQVVLAMPELFVACRGDVRKNIQINPRYTRDINKTRREQ